MRVAVRDDRSADIARDRTTGHADCLNGLSCKVRTVLYLGRSYCHLPGDLVASRLLEERFRTGRFGTLSYQGL